MTEACSRCGGPLAASDLRCPSCGADLPTLPPSQLATEARPRTSAIRLQDRFGKFRIVSEIGRGGMGVVYEAEDTVMVRRVALKTLSTEREDPESEARFLREARIAGTLDHPNVVSVHDFGTHEGIAYFTMPLVEGLSLESVIEHLHGRGKGPRPAFLQIPSEPSARVRLILEWFEGALEGLDHAHRKGIVHRDLKPSNLILDAGSGRLRIADFGLARAPHLAGLTRRDSLLGTVAYMSPEQVGRGGTAVDHRSDIYSMGVTLYQTLYDQLPYTAGTVGAYVEKIRAADPRLRPGRSPALHPDLRTILAKSMEKAAAHRYQTALEYAEDLRRFRRYEPIRARPVGAAGRLARWVRRKPGMAALTSVLLVTLATATGLFFAHARNSRIIRAAAAASMTRDGGFEAAVGSHDRAVALFSEALRLDPRNFEALIGRAISLGHFPGAPAHDPLADLEAAERLQPDLSSIHLLRGLHLRRSGDAAGAQAEERIARETPPRIALDYRLLGDIAILENDCPRAVELYSRAEEIDPRDFWAILRRGICHFKTGRLDRARIDYEIVAHLVPDHPSSHNNLGNVLQKQGDLDGARQAYERALEVDPNHATAHHNIGELLHAQGDLGGAEAEFRRALGIDPSHGLARASLGVVMLETARNDQGVEELLRVLREETERGPSADAQALATAHTNLCDTYLSRRDTPRAAAHCEEAVRLQPADPVGHYNLAAYRALTGDREGALASLERDLAAGDTEYDYLLGDEAFAALRNHPRFQAIVERMRAGSAARGSSR